MIDTHDHQHQQGCTTREIKVTKKDLPLSCPMSDERVWDAHPRVYLPIKDEKVVICPYCSTRYVLVEDSHAAA